MNKMLTVIYWDDINKQVIKNYSIPENGLDEFINEATELLETKQFFWVNTVHIDKKTYVREFADKEYGLACSLIVCGGMVTNINQIKKNEKSY